MAGLPNFFSDRIDALDAADNTTAAFGNLFTIESAVL
jgi:Na+/H+-translocating membrane pyrophosphatase